MSHTYPLGKTARDALKATGEPARTRYEAEDLAGGAVIKALETEWLTPSAADLPDLLALAEANPAHRFVQNYEDAAGNTVLAVTYWKLAKAATKPKAKPKPDPKTETEDHTDDLYFRAGRTKKSKQKPVDPNQLDLFGQPKAPSAD
jgi:hypothetical protein